MTRDQNRQRKLKHSPEQIYRSKKTSAVPKQQITQGDLRGSAMCLRPRGREKFHYESENKYKMITEITSLGWWQVEPFRSRNPRSSSRHRFGRLLPALSCTTYRLYRTLKPFYRSQETLHHDTRRTTNLHRQYIGLYPLEIPFQTRPVSINRLLLVHNLHSTLYQSSSRLVCSTSRLIIVQILHLSFSLVLDACTIISNTCSLIQWT